MGEYWCHSCNSVVQSLPSQIACNECRGEFIESIDRPSSERRRDGDRVLQNVIFRNIGPENAVYNIQLDQLINNAPLMFQIQGGRNGGLADLVNIKPKVAKKSVVQALPIIELAKEKVKELEECSICKHDYEVGEKVRCLPCEHLYHTECIDTWFNTNNSCPICRFELEVEEEPPGNNENQEGTTNSNNEDDGGNEDEGIEGDDENRDNDGTNNDNCE